MPLSAVAPVGGRIRHFVVKADDTYVSVYDSKGSRDVEVLLTDIVLTNTGLHFQYNAGGRTYSAPLLSVILRSGIEVFNDGGTGAPLEDGETMSNSYKWMFPIDLDDAVSLRFDNVEIPIPDNNE